MIIFDQPKLWTPEARDTVELAALVVGTALKPYTGLSAEDSFDAVFGEQHVRFNGGIENWAYSGGDYVIFRHKKYVTLPILLHEWGHTLDRLAGLKPSQELWAAKLDIKAGSLWPGFHPPGLDKYDINEMFANVCGDYWMQMLKQNAIGREIDAWFAANMGAWVATARAQR